MLLWKKTEFNPETEPANSSLQDFNSNFLNTKQILVTNAFRCNRNLQVQVALKNSGRCLSFKKTRDKGIFVFFVRLYTLLPRKPINRRDVNDNDNFISSNKFLLNLPTFL